MTTAQVAEQIGISEEELLALLEQAKNESSGGSGIAVVPDNPSFGTWQVVCDVCGRLTSATRGETVYIADLHNRAVHGESFKVHVLGGR